jgi:hypothetical protein
MTRCAGYRVPRTLKTTSASEAFRKYWLRPGSPRALSFAVRGGATVTRSMHFRARRESAPRPVEAPSIEE